MRNFPQAITARWARAALGMWTLPNTGVPLGALTGSAALNAVAGGRMTQAVVNTDESGHLWGTKPTYLALTQPVTPSPAGRQLFAIFNGSASGQDVEVEAILFQRDVQVAAPSLVSGLLVSMARITSLGAVGTGVNSIGGVSRPFVALDPNNVTLTNTIWLSEGGSGNNVGGVSSFFHRGLLVGSGPADNPFPMWPPAAMPMQIIQTIVLPPGFGLRMVAANSLGTAVQFGLLCSVTSH